MTKRSGLAKTDMVGLITMREACRLLNVHQNTLRRWAALGVIHEYRIGAGRQRRFKPSDVENLVQSERR